jgi:DNA-binding IscR family transcriptional regulator
MGEIEQAVARIARTRVRNALLELTRKGPREVRLETVAARAGLEPTVAAQMLRELESSGPFDIEPTPGEQGASCWRVA